MDTYEQLYKEALERARQVHATNVDENKKSTEYIFPVLKESEDEKIRGAIIDHLKDYNLTEWADWLEKQGNESYLQEKIESFTNAHKGEDPEGIIAACRGGEEQGEQKLANEPKFKVGDTIRLKNSLAEYTIESISDGRYYFKGSSIDIIDCDRDYYLVVPKLSNVESNGEDWNREDEQNLNAALGYIDDEYLRRWLKDTIHKRYDKPTEWSEEDKKIIGYIRHIVSEFDKIAKKVNEPCWYIGDCLLWLQHIELKGLPQSKQEWSEKDESHIRGILSILQTARGNALVEQYKDAINSDIDWLESLKQRIG